MIGKYDYSKFIYVNNHTKGIVICSKHGEFLITPSTHLIGVGCPNCSKQKPKNYWTKERCREEALKHNGRREWYKNSSSSYFVARKNGWLDELSQHMTRYNRFKVK